MQGSRVMFGIRGGEEEAVFEKAKGFESGFGGYFSAARVTLVPDESGESGFASSWPSWLCVPCSSGRGVGGLVLLSIDFMASGFVFLGNSIADESFFTAAGFLSHAVIDDCIVYGWEKVQVMFLLTSRLDKLLAAERGKSAEVFNFTGRKQEAIQRTNTARASLIQTTHTRLQQWAPVTQSRLLPSRNMSLPRT